MDLFFFESRNPEHATFISERKWICLTYENFFFPHRRMNLEGTSSNMFFICRSQDVRSYVSFVRRRFMRFVVLKIMSKGSFLINQNLYINRTIRFVFLQIRFLSLMYSRWENFLLNVPSLWNKKPCFFYIWGAFQDDKLNFWMCFYMRKKKPKAE